MLASANPVIRPCATVLSRRTQPCGRAYHPYAAAGSARWLYSCPGGAVVGRPASSPQEAKAIGAVESQGESRNRAHEERSDEALLEAYRTGEAAAFRALIERYRDDLLRFLLRFVGDRATAEDAFQEAFLQVHLAVDVFDPSRSFRPWLYTIAANKARDLLRRKARRPALELSAPIEQGGERGFVDLMQESTEPVGQRLDDAERDLYVQKAINAMPEHLKEILLLAYFQRLTYQQVAETLGIPLGTVKSRLHAAVASFARSWRQCVKGAGFDEEPAR